MTYFYDGTKESFLTAFVLSYGDEDARLASSPTQLALGQQSVFVRTDLKQAEKAEKRFVRP